MAAAGNPTMFHEVTATIDHVKRLEVRKLGRPSRRTRPLEMNEFIGLQSTILGWWGEMAMSVLYGFTAYMVFSFSMIARVDDTAHLKKSDFRPHPLYPSKALYVRLNWSKNVRSEARCPWQILMGAMNPRFCVLLHLAAFLEMHHADITNDHSPYIFSWTDDHEEPRGAETIRYKMSSALKRALQEFFEDQDVDAERDGRCGTHSVRKFGGGHVTRCGHPVDHKDYRGRWRGKNSNRVSSVYEYVEKPFVDAKVCSTLCIGGACTYVLKEPVTDAFVTTHVTPNITRCFGPVIGLLLGKALLWGIFDHEWSQFLPQGLKDNVKNAYMHLYPENPLPEGANPVEKKLLVVSGHEGQVVLTEVNHPGENQNNQGQPMPAGDGVQQALDVAGGIGDGQLAALLSMQADTTRAVSDLNQLIQANHTMYMDRFQSVRTVVNRLDRRNRLAVPVANVANGNVAAGQAAALGNGGGGGPANDGHQGAEGNGAAAGAVVAPVPNIDPRAVLSPRPPNLHVLWEEFVRGVGPNKAARDFTPRERGRVKQQYSHRRVFWDVVDRMLRRDPGLTAAAAIDTIYGIYGQGLPVTRIIRRIKDDVSNNQLHPMLQG